MKEIEIIVKELADLSQLVSAGFDNVNESIDALKDRLGKHGKKIHKVSKEQHLQASEIENLKKVVTNLANSDGWQYGEHMVAIRKEPAYEGFEEYGVGKRTAMRALRDAGTIKTDSQNKSTCTVRVDGKTERVIIVFSN